jgi:aminoglycoside phosphotransferase (APT) family kinase protein
VLLHADFKPSNLHWATDDRLLVLDWEFAYAGTVLSDVGQLLRWEPPSSFTEAFAVTYRTHGGELVEDWQLWAAAFDLVNLAGLLRNFARRSDGGDDSSARILDIEAALRENARLARHSGTLDVGHLRP